MSIFDKLFKKSNDPSSFTFKLNRAKELHGKVVKYVTENRNGNDDVVGRGGSMSIHDGKFLIDTSGERLFLCEIADLEASYLMSGDGVIITGPNLLENGKIRTVTVHFVYYRK